MYLRLELKTSELLNIINRLDAAVWVIDLNNNTAFFLMVLSKYMEESRKSFIMMRTSG